jgi:hypothetical protein
MLEIFMPVLVEALIVLAAFLVAAVLIQVMI